MPNFQSYKQGIFNCLNPNKYRGKLPIHYRSKLEFKFCQFCDCNPNVVTWGIESTIIPYIDDSRRDERNNPTKHNYVIDFTVCIKDKFGKLNDYLVEIKPEKETKPPKMTKKKNEQKFMTEANTYIRNQCKWKAAKLFAESRGMKFLVINEKDLSITDRK